MYGSAEEEDLVRLQARLCTNCGVNFYLDVAFAVREPKCPDCGQETTPGEVSSDIHIYFSKRGHPLVWATHPPLGVIAVTVENYMKWYGLHLIHPDGRVDEIPFPSDLKYGDSTNTSHCCDHAPNPMWVQRFCHDKGYLLDLQALEMIIGRWEIEYHADKSRYHIDLENPWP